MTISRSISNSLLIALLYLWQALAIIHPSSYKYVKNHENRDLMHMHIERAAMYGNSTQLMYYFSDVFVGDFDNPSKQSLIVDTGSGYTCFPCEGYCTHCGKHLNSYYEIDESKTKEILN